MHFESPIDVLSS